jgi:hypothetical protein
MPPYWNIVHINRVFPINTSFRCILIIWKWLDYCCVLCSSQISNIIEFVQCRSVGWNSNTYARSFVFIFLEWSDWLSTWHFCWIDLLYEFWFSKSNIIWLDKTFQIETDATLRITHIEYCSLDKTASVQLWLWIHSWFLEFLFNSAFLNLECANYYLKITIENSWDSSPTHSQYWIYSVCPPDDDNRNEEFIKHKNYQMIHQSKNTIIAE